MEPEPQINYELTDAGWKVVNFLKADRYLSKPDLRLVDKPARPALPQAEEPLQQAAGSEIVVRIAAELAPDLWTEGIKDLFYDENGSRTPEGITLASYLLTLAEIQEGGHSPTLKEWGERYATYGGKKVSGQMVAEKVDELVTLGLIRKLVNQKRSAIVSDEGREWLWKLSKYADAPSIMSNLMASGKITADDVKAAMGPSDPNDKAKFMTALGLDPLGRKPGAPTHLPLRE